MTSGLRECVGWLTFPLRSGTSFSVKVGLGGKDAVQILEGKGVIVASGEYEMNFQ